VVTFRLYPEPGRTLYVRVNVHRTKKAMREYWRTTDARFGGGTWDKRQGYCQERSSWKVNCDRRMRRDPCIAEVNMYRAALVMGIVTHEMLHAAVAWGRRTHFNWQRLEDDDSVNQDEERFAYAHSELCRQFMVRAIAAGLYD